MLLELVLGPETSEAQLPVIPFVFSIAHGKSPAILSLSI